MQLTILNNLKKIKISWYGKHFGEEPPFVGNKNQGAGGIFFSGCNLRCVFCQNFQISQNGLGEFYTEEKLAEIMLELQKQGACNIDLVTPTIWWQGIKFAIQTAKRKGLTIPILWNSNGFEDIEIIKEMEGLVDIYLPDFKYSDDRVAEKYSKIKNYKETAISAIDEMIKQVGNLQFDKDGNAVKGIVIRHMILPNNVQNSTGVIDEIAKRWKETYVSLMGQYFPIHNAKNFPELTRQIIEEEYETVFNHLIDSGIENGWAQELESGNFLIPDFTKEKPFTN